MRLTRTPIPLTWAVLNWHAKRGCIFRSVEIGDKNLHICHLRTNICMYIFVLISLSVMEMSTVMYCISFFDLACNADLRHWGPVVLHEASSARAC